MIRSKAARTNKGRSLFRVAAISAAVIGAYAASNAALAFEIDTGNEDLVMRWDNTFRYNLGVRAQKQDSAILGNANADDGDRNFSNGSLVTNRLDVLSEFDIVWQKKYGMRVSATGWYDQAYTSLDGTNTATANTLVNGLPVAGQLSPYTKRYAKGLSGEWLDAFVFGNFDVAGVPSTSRPASTPCTGAKACFWAAWCTALPIRRTPSTSGRGCPRRAARRRSSSGRAAGSPCRRSRRTTCRLPGSGSTTGRRCGCPSRARTSKTTTCSSLAAIR